MTSSKFLPLLPLLLVAALAVTTGCDGTASAPPQGPAAETGHGGDDGDHGHGGGDAHGDEDSAGHDGAGQERAGEDGHGHDEEEGHGEESAVRMDRETRERMGIVTATVERRALAKTVSAPGEVRLNAYRTAQVTPRIAAQVLARHARLGDVVRAGQPLVTLSSVEMAEAQGRLLVADREWRRVKKLGRKVVSEKRYVQAQVARQQAYAQVLGYGMAPRQIEALLATGDASRASGTFDLLAPQAGRVIRDEFVVGEMIEPGRVLFEIADERTLWVEARLAPEDAARVATGTPARVSVDGMAWLEGKVIQRHHTLDEATRTQAVRIEVDNRDDLLHPGQFVKVELETGRTDPVLAVPEGTVIFMEGRPTVFVLRGDEFEPRPVDAGPTRGGWRAVRSGLAGGETVVTQGAFLIKSLMLKSKMGEGHAH